MRSGTDHPVYGSNGVVGKHRVALVQGPGIVVGRKGSVGAVTWSETDFWPIDTTYYVAAKGKNVFRYLYWLLTFLPLARLDSATGVPGLNRSDAYRVSAYLPEPDEQQNVSAVLDLIDATIQKTDALIAKLKLIKEGLLHDLLTRGIDCNGGLRDPESSPHLFRGTTCGRIPSVWTPSSVNAEFEVDSGFTLGQHRKPIRHRRPYLRVANVQREQIVLDDVAELEATDQEFAARKLAADDLLVVEGHADPNDIGRCAIVEGAAVGMTFQNHLFRLRTRAVNPQFAMAWLNSRAARSYWRRMCGTSSGLNTINRTMLKAMPFAVPPPDEQARISVSIRAATCPIGAEERQLAKLTLLKHGLMHDLLTGRVRVPLALSTTS